MSPSAVVATWNPQWRLTSHAFTCQSRPVIVLQATESGLPILVYFYRTSREDLMRVRCVNISSDMEPEGVYDADEARAFYRKLTENGFERIK